MSHKTIKVTDLVTLHHQIGLWRLDARGSPTKWLHSLQYSSEMLYGAFKSMWEGQIDLGGHCPFLSTQASSHAAMVASIALKQPYLPNYISTSDSSMSMVSTLCLSPDDQVKIWLLIPSPFSGQVHCFKTFMTSLQDIIKVTTMSHAL